MKKTHFGKTRAKELVKQLRCNIKTMRIGRMTEMQSVFDTFEIKFFGKDEKCRIERKKGFVKEFFQK
jgi:hypothetical protein